MEPRSWAQFWHWDANGHGGAEGAVPGGAGCWHRSCGTGAEQRRGDPRSDTGQRGRAQCSRGSGAQPCENRNKTHLKYSAPEPPPAIMLPMTAVVAVVTLFPFRSLASPGTGSEDQWDAWKAALCQVSDGLHHVRQNDASRHLPVRPTL